MYERTIRVLEYNKIINMLAGYTKSQPGKELALNLRPSKDKEIVTKWLKETEEAESILAIEGTSFISPFENINLLLRKARIGSSLSPKELLQIEHVLSLINSVKKRMKEHKRKAELNVIPAMIDNLVSQPVLLKNIQSCIETEESLYDNASPELAKIRRQITRAEDKIRDRLNGFLHSAQQQKFLQDPIITIRNDRYVLPVKQENRSNIPGIIHDQSSSGATIYVEPMSVVEANNELRQLTIQEKDEIERILTDLTSQVDFVSSEIGTSLDLLINLDFIFAKGAFSIAIRGSCPIIVDSPSIKIVNGRHPLIDKKEVVPITIELGMNFNTLVITGPNTGGKTVTLKTTGLFVLMAQSGLYLPADYGTQMGIFDNVYADIGDEQSIEQSLSTFSSHMSNIVNILKGVESRDLVLFDELGAGTDPTEGAALAMSILDYLHTKDIRVMATTHYSELKIYAISRANVENASVEFDVKTLSPTYKLLIGLPGKSNAFEISKRLGLSDPIIDNAQKYLSQENIHFEDVMSKVEEDRLTAEKDRQKADEYLKEIADLKRKHQDAVNALEERKANELSKAKEEARRIVRQAKAEAELIITDLKNIAKAADEKSLNKAVEESKRKLKTAKDKYEESIRPRRSYKKPPENLKLGETVHVIDLNQNGQILELPNEEGIAVVQVGIMKVNTHISNLRRAEEESTGNVKTYKNIKLNIVSISPELDLRGQNAEEAKLLTDRYLDDAFISGLKEVTIIHGKGTGTLRNSIHQMLKSHPQVDSFRIGKYGEGETGVTIVTLK